MDIKIESGLEIPKKKSGQRHKYPFKNMKINDSFVVDAPSGTAPLRFQAGVGASAHSYGMRHDKKFATRKHGRSVRVWRIK